MTQSDKTRRYRGKGTENTGKITPIPNITWTVVPTERVAWVADSGGLTRVWVDGVEQTNGR